MTWAGNKNRTELRASILSNYKNVEAAYNRCRYYYFDYYFYSWLAIVILLTPLLMAYLMRLMVFLFLNN